MPLGRRRGVLRAAGVEDEEPEAELWGRGGAGRVRQVREVREVKAGSRRGQGGSERTIIHVRLGQVGRETGKLQTFEVRHATRRNKTRERADS